MKNRPPALATTNILDSDRIGKLLFTLSLPAFLGMFVQTLYNVINTIFVGHSVGALGIAGLSIVFPLQMLGMGMGQMVGVGGTSLISRYIGAGRQEDAEKTLGNGLSIGVGISIVVILVILPFINFWLRLIGASEAVLPFARDYLTIIMYSLPFQILAMALLNYSRAEGNARVGMVAMIIGAIVNIIFDFIFIIGLDMGVKGAAWATFLSQAVSLVYFLLFYFNGNSYLRFRLKYLKIQWSIIRPVFSIGIGAFMQSVSGSLSGMILISATVTYGGDYALSAMGIIQRAFMFAVIPSIGIAQGAQPILGYNYGARRFKLALKVVLMAFLASTALGTLSFFVLYFTPEPIFRIFTDDPQLIATAVSGARFMLLGLPLLGFINCGIMVFQAIGRAVPAFIAAVGRNVFFLIPIVLILPRAIGLNGVWLAFPGSDVLTVLLTIVLVLPILRKFRRQAREQETSTGVSGPRTEPGTLPPAPVE